MKKKRKIAFWITDRYEFSRCSACGFEFDEPEYTEPTCPNCGREMADTPVYEEERE